MYNDKEKALEGIDLIRKCIASTMYSAWDYTVHFCLDCIVIKPLLNLGFPLSQQVTVKVKKKGGNIK